MALNEFKYPSQWTVDFKNYETNREQIVKRIHDYMINYETYLPVLQKQVRKLQDDFYTGPKLNAAIGTPPS